MTKKEANRLLQRCYRLLENPKVALGFAQLQEGISGEVVIACGVITIDPLKDALTTVLHECLHLLFPDASEAKVLQLEREMASQLTTRQWKNRCGRIGANGRKRT